MSSPSSPITAMSSPMGTASPSAISCLSNTPSSKASRSIVALSVSTCASTSPEETSSPSSTSQAESTPSSIVSLSLGISIGTAMFRF
jgi:hypothetical protein